MNIMKNQRFLDDVKNYSTQINEINDPQHKQEVQRLFYDFINAVKKMDSMHQEMAYTHTLSTSGNELREGIKTARIKLDKKLKENFTV